MAMWIRGSGKPDRNFDLLSFQLLIGFSLLVKFEILYNNIVLQINILNLLKRILVWI